MGNDSTFIERSDSFETPIFLIGQKGADPLRVANELAAFVKSARRSLHVAIYDFQLEGAAKDLVVGAFNEAATRGVDVRIAYDHTKQGSASDVKGGDGSDPAKRGTHSFVPDNFPTSGPVKTTAIAGSHLMHNKYIIRDGSAVWMGSANFTEGAWTLQENNILRIHSRDLADRYEEDFDDLWKSGNILHTGKNDYAALDIGGDKVEVAFAPGEGSAAASLFVDAIQGAGTTIWLSTMVLSSEPILGSLCDHLENGGSIEGTYDGPQMKSIANGWQKTGSSKLPLWEKIEPHLKGKPSTPFDKNHPTAPHDFMHNKILLTDKVVVTGSFNLSRDAEANAENVLSLHVPELVAAYKGYFADLKRSSATW